MTPREIIANLLEHVEVLYADNVSDHEGTEAFIEMERILLQNIEWHVDNATEKLRGALDDLYQQHSRKMSVSGKCECSPCRAASKLIDGNN